MILIVLLAGLSLSALLIYLTSGEALLGLAYFGGVLLLLLGFALFDRTRNATIDMGASPPDWSVTLAAIDEASEAIAITDRANRLVCANTPYRANFSQAKAPVALALENAEREALARLAREAWRDGKAELPRLTFPGSETAWRITAHRAGRGDDHLIWRMAALAVPQSSAALEVDLAGPLGQMLSRAGIETALTTPQGIICSVSSGFAERAVGDSTARLAGRDFVGFLRTDERDRIYFAHEGRAGTPQTLIDVPLREANAEGAPINEDEPASLMLLIDSGVGIGSGWEGAAQAGISQLDALLSQLPLGLAMVDRDGRFLFANEAFLRAVGREERGLPVFPTDLVVREDKAALSDAVRRHGRGPAISGDMAVRLIASPEEPAVLGLASVRGLGEAAVLLSLGDSAQENQLKRQVAQATKMQAVGQLAGGVAHDFNNVLTAIIGTCDLMLLRHIPGDSDYDDIQQIRANSNRAASLTRQLLAFSRQQTLRPEILQLPDVVSEVSPLIKRLVGEKIDFYVQHDRNLGPVRADPQQLEQVIMNLAVNARDAIQSQPGGQGAGQRSGRISLFTRSLQAREVVQLGSEVLPAADYTVLIVQDTGGGIAPHVLPKLFEPFFTTKEQGKGTGLGLSTAYGIVKQSGGFIFADNVLDKQGRPIGARFTIYFPVHRGAAPQRREAAPVVSSDWSAGGKVLLVEDEDMVRTVAERALVRAGYQVTACASGEEGLAAIAEGEFDLVVSDVVMPGMDGPAMVRAIRARLPDMPVLFMSGYAEEHLRKDIDIPDMHFLAKPFSVAAIGDKVGAVLREARASV